MKILIENIYDTIQGEGYHTGTPCTFVRTWGCPVGCWFCDTGYATGATPPAKKQLVDIETIDPPRHHVVISGGEPMVQRAVAPLIRLLITRGHFVQVETSGVVWRDVPNSCWITFSPKMQIGARCAGQFWRRADEVKIVISNATDAGLYDPDLRSFSGRIYFQPEYSRMQETVPDCVRACLKYGGKISTQIHKTLQLP